MIGPTDEMVAEAMEAFNATGSYRDAVAAVLALVERDLGLIGPCSAALPHLFDAEFAEFCELRHGHSGDHESGPTRWRVSP